MKNSFRQSMSWLHTWAGLALGGVLYFIFITGTAGYFDAEIDRWMQPEFPFNSVKVDQVQLLVLAEQRLKQVAPDAHTWSISFPIGREPLLNLWWRSADSGWQNEKLDQHTGEPVTARDTGGGQLLFSMHYALHYMPATLAYWIVSLSTMFMLVTLITGIIVHKKIFKDFFTFRPSKKPRAWLDMHNVLSVLPLPFHLMITYSGLIFLMSITMPGVITASYGMGEENINRFTAAVFSDNTDKEAAGVKSELAALSIILADAQRRWSLEKIHYIEIKNVGDAHARVKIVQLPSSGIGHGEALIYDGASGELLPVANKKPGGAFQFYEVMTHLHEGLFAGIILRWLYFLSGLMGAAMIATGMILWAVKRRAKAQKKGKSGKGLILVEYLNVGIIVGLPIGVATYFWANRLIPAEMEGRADWEVHTLFICWGLALLYPVLRRCTQRSWIELLWVAAALYSCLPLLNIFTSQRHLGISLMQQDWVMAGFDLTVLAFGIGFGMAAIKMQSKQARSLATAASTTQGKNTEIKTP